MKRKQMLNGTWELSSPTEKKHYGPAEVPGSVMTTWLETGEIEDPFWRTNEYEIRDRMSQDYVFERTFEVSCLSDERIELVCEGLDTSAMIYLNGELLAHVNDMHRTYRFPVRNLLRTGENQIRILFESALELVRREDRTNDIHYAATGCIPGNAVLRKAHYMFGWDWGPQLPDAGIFRDIYLEYQSGTVYEDVRILQQHENGEVKLAIACQLKKEIGRNNDDKDYKLRILLEHPNGEREDHTVPYQECVTIPVVHPQLWWPNGIGEQPLYRLTVDLMDLQDHLCDSFSRRIGLRTITVCTDAHAYGNEFCFVVNGVKIFAMGADYVPQDNLIPRVTGERYRNLIFDAKEANFNCIRVWGGGYYPDEAFYDACDEAGILIWQDLMFACNVYRLTDAFEQNITAETKDIVLRLRDHACLALWCGNNEMEWAWGDMWERVQGHHPRYKADYLKIFEYILAKTVRQYDGVTFWWPSSPSSGGSYDAPNTPERGDQHYWEVWHSGKPFTEYRKYLFSFCSEYGFQSFPGMKTIESFTLPEDRNIFSEVMEAHQKNRDANGRILNYISGYFLYPRDLSSLVYISQILQLKAIQYGVEHWRRNRGRCMGSLYWQLDDCWPVASWASIDYYGRWKALHYGAKRFYRPVMVSACEEQELSTRITYYLHNDTREEVHGKLRIMLKDRELMTLYTYEIEAQAGPMEACSVRQIDFRPYIPDGKRGEVLAVAELEVSGEIVSRQTTLFVKPKHFRYQKVKYHVDICEETDEILLRIKSDCFAQYVEVDFADIDLKLSDNYFDITDPEGRVISISKKSNPQITAEQIRNSCRIRSVADTY